MELAPGTVLDGRFVIRRKLGAGGFGTVYLAEQQVFEIPLRQVAVKLFRRELVTEASASEQFNDAAILMRLQAEAPDPDAARHLITMLDAGFLRDAHRQAFVTMEYVPGYNCPGGGTARTLRDMIEVFSPVPVKLALHWIAQVLRAVGWMHILQPPVLHCDLKPDNILPDGPGTLKVADFGLAQLTSGAAGLSGGAGTLTYQSPETLADVEPTAASDVYSLGLLLYEILCGHNPLAEVGLAEAAAGDRAGFRRQHIAARRAGLRTLTAADNPDLAEHPLVGDIIARCLRFAAPERYPNAAMLLADVTRYTTGEPLSVARSGIGDESPAELNRLLAEAESLRRSGSLAEARDRADTALLRYPGLPGPYLCLARLHLDANDWRDALQLCARGRDLPELSPADSARLLELSAQAYRAGGNTRLADVMRDRATAARGGAHR